MRPWPKLVCAVAIIGVVAGLLLLGPCFPAQIHGPSMRPWLVSGDWVLVHGVSGRDVRRGDILVFKEPDSGVSAVKRVVALPEEEVLILDGDVFINGFRVSPFIPNPSGMIPLVHARGAGIEESFGVKPLSPSVRSTGEGLLAGAGFFEPHAEGWVARNTATAFLLGPPRDGMLFRGERVPGQRPAEDLGIEVDVELLLPSSVWFVVLREGDTSFFLSLGQQGREVRLSSHRGEKVLELAVVRGLPYRPRGKLFLTLANQTLQASLNDEPLILPMKYSGVEPIVLADVPASVRWEQAGFGGDDALFREARVARDYRWGNAGTYACGEVLGLGGEEVFVLGDNSESSRDSRQYGPVKISAIRGRVGLRFPLSSQPPKAWIDG